MEAWRDWDIPSIQLMFEHWKKHPPLTVMVAAYLGIGKESKPREQDPETGLTLFDLGGPAQPFNPVPGARRG